MFFKNSIKKILNSKVCRKIGISLINYDMLKYTKHYLWIFNFRKIPTLKIIFNKAKDVTEEDISICQRLISAYRLATLDRARIENNTSQLWSEGIKMHCGRLIPAMESGSAQGLARILAFMFREDFVYGLASGSLVENAHSCIGAKIWSLKYQDNLIALAEYLGVVRNESSQQGARGYGLKEGLDTVVAKIEEAIGIPMDFPDIGSPYGVKANNSLITMEHPEHLYVALRISHVVRDYLKHKEKQLLNLVEIGAGFGGLAYWTIKLKKINLGTYTIIDLPLINVLQGYFLMKAFGSSKVSLYGEVLNKDAMISILPAFAFQAEIKNDIDMLINENSMPEMSKTIVENYIQLAKKKVSGLFFSYNHEAYSIVYGKPQVLVPEIISRIGGFCLLSRNASWMRNGYVEETYRCVENSKD